MPTGFFDTTVTGYCRGGWPLDEVKTVEQSCWLEWNRLTLVWKATLQESVDRLTHQEHLKDKWLPGQPVPIVDTLRSIFGNTVTRRPRPEDQDRRYDEVIEDIDHLMRAQVLAKDWIDRSCYLY
jgi:hypothetical protein